MSGTIVYDVRHRLPHSRVISQIVLWHILQLFKSVVAYFFFSFVNVRLKVMYEHVLIERETRKYKIKHTSKQAYSTHFFSNFFYFGKSKLPFHTMPWRMRAFPAVIIISLTRPSMLLTQGRRSTHLGLHVVSLGNAAHHNHNTR